MDGDRVKVGIIDSGFDGFKPPNARRRAVFGKVTSGMDVVLAIQQGDVMESVDITRNNTGLDNRSARIEQRVLRK